MQHRADVHLYALLHLDNPDKQILEAYRNRTNEYGKRIVVSAKFENIRIHQEIMKDCYLASLILPIPYFPYQFKLRLHNKGIIENFVEETGSPWRIIDGPEESPIFLLNIHLEKKKYFFWNPHEMLLYYAMFFIKSGDFNRFVELIIRFYIFFTEESLLKYQGNGFGEGMGRFQQSMEGFLKCHPNVLRSIFITLGCLPGQGEKYTSKAFGFLQGMLPITQMENIGEVLTLKDPFVDRNGVLPARLMEGISLVYYMNGQEARTDNDIQEWVFQCMKIIEVIRTSSRGGGRADQTFIIRLLNLWATSPNPHLHFLAYDSFISSFEALEGVFLLIISVAPSIIPFTQGIFAYAQKMEKTAALQETTIRIRRIAQNYTRKYKFTMQEIVDVLEISKKWPESIAKALYSGMSAQVLKILSVTAEFVAQDIALVGIIFFDFPYSHHMLNQTAPNRYAKYYLMKIAFIEFKIIYDHFISKLHEVELFELVEAWLLSKFESRIKAEEILREIDNCFSDKENTPFLLRIFELVIHNLWEMKAKMRIKTFLEEVVTINACKCVELKKLFVTFVEINMINKLRGEILMNTRDSPYLILEKIKSKQKDENELINILINKMLPMMEPPSEKLVMENVIEEPSEHHYWVPMIRSKDKSEYLIQLSQIIIGLIAKLHKMEISFHVGVKIQTHSELQREILILFLKRAMKITPPKSQDIASLEPENVVINIIEKMDNIFKEKEQFKAFLLRYGRDLENRTPIQQSFDKLFADYKTTIVSQFSYPPLLASFASLSFEYHEILHSESLDRIYSHTKSVERVNSENMKEVIMNSINQLDQVIQDILINGGETKMLTVNEYFGKISKLEKHKIIYEVDLLQNFMPKPEDKAKFRDLLLFFSEIHYIYESCNSIINFLEIMHLNDEITETNCSMFVNNYENLLEQTIDEFFQRIDHIKDILQIELEEFREVYMVMIELSKSSDLLGFLKNMNLEDIESLREGVNDFDESFLQTQTVLELVTVYYYIKQISEKKTYAEIKEIMYQNVTKNEYAKMNKLIAECRTNLNAFKTLFQELTKKEEAKKRKILLIMKDSKFEVVKHKIFREKWEVELKYQSDKSKQIVIFDLPGLLELRDRALLILNTEESKIKKEEEETVDEMTIFREYIDFSNTINSLIGIMNELEYNGYPIWEEVKTFTLFECYKSYYGPLKEKEEQLSENLGKWKQFLREACYQTNYSMTHLFGKRFWDLEKFLLTREHSSQAENLLHFMQKDVGYFERHEEKDYDLRQGYYMRIIHLSSYIKDTIPDAGIERASYGFKDRRIEHEEGMVVYFETSNLIHGILSIFASEGEMPKANQLLFCASTTSWQELMSFVFRAFLHPNHNIFLIVRANALSRENQIDLFNLFEKLYNENFQERKCRLAILATESTSRIAETFKIGNYTNVVREHSTMNPAQLVDIVKRIDAERTLIVESKIAGLGKTRWIENDVEDKSFNLILIPISGNLTLESFGERLLRVEMRPQLALCFQVSVVSNQDILIEIFIQIILLRCLNTPLGIINIPADTRIYIEIANTTGQRLSEFNTFCKHFNQYKIKELNIHELGISNDYQIVCNHLKALQNGNIDTTVVMDGNMNGFFPNEVLGKEEVIKLLKMYFLDPRKQRGEESSYIQLTLFVQVFAQSLKSFFYSPFIPFMLKEMGDTNQALRPLCSSLRSVMVAQLMETTKEFTTKTIKNVKEQQVKALSGMAAEDEGGEAEGIENMYKDIITWESTNHFFLLFSDGGTFIPIYRNPSVIPNPIKKFMTLQEGLASGMGEAVMQNMHADSNLSLKNYSTMTHDQLMAEIHRILNTYPNHDPGYILTADNFLKMMLIFRRVNARIPVIIMGETGVGKTSLIRYLVKNILKEELVIYGIHAGVNVRGVLKQIREYDDMAIAENKRIWVFLDEFNTTDAIGLLNEIICNRKMQGSTLSDHLVFVAACNPYRLKNKKICFDENVGIRKEKLISKGSTFRLLYTVHPLPETMLNYVWDFGELTPQDEKKYISTILEMSEHITAKHYQIFAPAVFAAHKYFKSREDMSSVSLRDVQRYKTIMEFFIRTMKEKHAEYVVKVDNITRAGILAMIHCYFLRLANKKHRRQFMSKLSLIFKLNPMRILEICEEEQNDYLRRMEFPEEIARNEALKENVFAMLVCIVNKIPIFVCGKPGCSKTLAISLLMANLRGKQSTDQFFRQLPELTKVYFQGSSSCTSESIIKAFENAENYLKSKTTDELLPVVVFDEIGLAEISKYNPLKVLHERLERENIKVGFIGISNWRLDASKMNRALYLARPDPDLEDLQYTAECIYNSINQGKTRFHLVIMQNLSKAYFQFKKELKGTAIEDVYGLRDFYHIIKMVSREFKRTVSTHEHDLLEIVKRGLERNFDGEPVALRKIMGIFTRIQCCQEAFSKFKNSTALELIESNLRDTDARYLMVISYGDSGTYILERFLHKQIIENQVIVGSPFEEDVEKEEYGIRCLSDIILYMEKGVSVILKGLEDIYSSLYDLFNQSFAISGGRRRCRIALGALYNPNCLVHENFHCIIFMEKNRMDKQDPPFLNRFEKHFLSFEDILTRKQLMIVEDLEEWIRQITTSTDEKQTYITTNHIFINYNKDKLGLLVLENSETMLEATSEEILSRCKYELIALATPDFLVISALSGIDELEWHKLYGLYCDTHSETFKDVLKSLYQVDEHSKNIIVFTYSHNLPDYFVRQSGDIKHRNMTNYKREADVKRETNEFFASKTERIFILEIELSSEYMHLSHFKYLAEQLIAESEDPTKRILIIVHMRRNFKYANKYDIPLFEGWKQLFIEDIAKEDNKVYLTPEVVRSNSRTLLKEGYSEKLSSIIEQLIEKCFLKINYDANTKDLHSKVFSHVRQMCEQIPAQEKLMFTLEQKIIKDIQFQPLKDWKEEMFSNHEIFTTSSTTHEAFRKSIFIPVEVALTKIIFTLENKFAFSSFFTLVEPIGLLQVIWLDYFTSLRIDPNLRLHNISQSLITPTIFDLKFPFSKYEFERLQSLRKEYFSSGKNDDQFIENYKERTILRDSYKEFTEAYALQNIYFEDMIKQLFKDIFDEDYSFQFFFSFIYCCEQFSQNKFEETLIFLIDKENLLINLVTLINDCSIFFEYSVSDFIVGSTQELSGKLFDKVEDYTSHLVNKMLVSIFPKHQAFERTKTLPNFKFKLEQIYTEVNKLILDENLTIEEDKLTRIDFWIQFTDLVILVETPKKEIGVLLDMGDKYLSCFMPNKFFYSKENRFMKDIDEYFNKAMGRNSKSSASINKFQAKKAVAFIKNDPTMGLENLKEIEKYDLYTHLGSEFVSFLVHKTNLINQIKHIINFNNPDFELNSDLEGYTDLMETGIKYLGLESHFANYIHDYLCRSFYFKSSTLPQDLAINSARFSFWHNIFEWTRSNKIKEYSNIKGIIGKMYVGSYLEGYSRHICNNKGRALHVPFVEGLLMDGGTTGEQMRIYCLNCIQEILALSKNGMYHYLQDNMRNYQWMQLIPMSPPTTPISIFPILNHHDIERGMLKWIQIFTQLLLHTHPTAELLSKSLDFLDMAESNHYGKQAFILGLILTCSPINLESPGQTKPLLEWIDNHNKQLSQKFGYEVLRFALLVASNFPGQVTLRVTKEEEQKTHQKLLMQVIIAIILSFGDIPNPISSLYFVNGRIGTMGDISTVFNSLFPFGTKSDFLLEYFKTLLNLDSNFQYQLYSCSSSCPFLYFIENCGKAWVKGKCPICKKTIGGENHHLESRAGHEQIPKEQAKDYIKNRISKRERECKRGYTEIAPPSDSQIKDTARDLDPFSFRFLHLILHVQLKYFYDVYNNQNYDKIIQLGTLTGMGIDGFLQKHIDKDFELLGKMVNNNESHIWLYKIISELPRLLSKFYQVPNASNHRDSFEKAFEKNIIKPNTTSISSAINEYKSYFKTVNTQAELIGNYNPIQHEMTIYRYCKMPTQELLEMIYNLGNNKEKYPLLDIVFQKSEDLKRIQGLLPIINFTNYLIDIFSFRITREDARTKTLNFYLKEDTQLEILWKEFLKGWSMGNFHEGVSYKCAHIKNTEFNSENELIFFLVDTIERGNGLYMAGALYTLSLLHNNLINHFQQLFALHKKMTQTVEDDIQLPVQSVSFKDCIQMPIHISDIPTEYSFNNPTKGSELIFDFERIEKHLLQAFLGKKKLGGEDLATMQYQFELLQLNSKHSTLIEEIRKNIPQTLLAKELKNMINGFIDEIGKRRSVEEYCHGLKEIMGSLEYILIHLKNAKENAICSLDEFIGKINKASLTQLIQGKSPITAVKVGSIVSLYEIIEEKYFPYFKEFVGLAYRSEEHKEEVLDGLSTFHSFLLQSPTNPDLETLTKVVRRFIMRCLIGEIQGDIPIQFYLKRGDFWPQEFDEDFVDELMDQFPPQIQVKHTILIVDALDQKLMLIPGALIPKLPGGYGANGGGGGG